MARLYDKPVWQLMWEMVEELGLQPGETVSRKQVNDWFATKYPRVKPGTIQAHLLKMSTNAPSRHHYGARPKHDDLFYQIDGSTFRLYDATQDPAPIYERTTLSESESDEPTDEEENLSEFAYEKDLQSFLARNLHLLQPGLSLYDDEGLQGIEYPAGGRFIDILAVDGTGALVVIELKVSRGYDRTVGQLLRYMGWIEENLAEDGQAVRGMIVARDISQDLQLAARRVPGVDLYEYQLSVSLAKV